MHFEIDMAFKRIHGTTNEWEVSAYLPRVQKSKYIYLINAILPRACPLCWSAIIHPNPLP